jgi:hypothetical protein
MMTREEAMVAMHGLTEAGCVAISIGMIDHNASFGTCLEGHPLPIDPPMPHFNGSHSGKFYGFCETALPLDYPKPVIRPSRI